MHAISLFVCWWFANGTLLHAFCTFSFWTKSKPLNWNRRREKNMKGASELYWTKWSMLSGLTVYEQEKGREKGMRESPLYLFFFSLPLFFFYCEVYLSAAPLQSSQSSLTTEDMFSLCEIQSLWYAGKLLFSTPNCCLWEASVKNSFSFQSEFDKSTKMKSACSYFPITRLCMRIRNLLVWFGKSAFFFFFSFSLYFEVRTCTMYATLDTKKADGFLSWIGLLLNYIGTLSCEVYSLITILLKNTGVILGSYKMEDGVKNTFVS